MTKIYDIICLRDKQFKKYIDIIYVTFDIMIWKIIVNISNPLN